MSPRLFCRRCARVSFWARGEELVRMGIEREERHAREDRELLLQLGA